MNDSLTRRTFVTAAMASALPLARAQTSKPIRLVVPFTPGGTTDVHRPHPSPKTDKGAVVSVRKWLEQHGVKP